MLIYKLILFLIFSDDEALLGQLHYVCIYRFLNINLQTDFLSFQMMKHSWDSYVKYAWGHNELKPISRRGHSASIFGSSQFGATIVDGLDTLYIMGLMDEYKRGRDWVAQSLTFQGVSRPPAPPTPANEQRGCFAARLIGRGSHLVMNR